MTSKPDIPVESNETAYSSAIAAAGASGDQTKGLAGSLEKIIGTGDFDQTELLGSAAGMTDVTVTVMGKSVVLPFSQVNPHLAMLGSILQAVTFLMCAVIVSGLRSRG